MSRPDAPSPVSPVSPIGPALAVAITLLALARCVIFFAPQVLFDIDPALDPNPIGGLGPAGSLTLDAALLALSVVALGLSWRRGEGVDGLVLALAVLPLPVVLWHGAADAASLYRGVTWCAAAFAAVTVAHAMRREATRGLVVAILVAGTLPVFTRGVANVTYEHADTVAQYEAQSDAFLRARGWEPGSAAALIFERRLRQRHPSGWFMTTNVFGSVAAFACVLGFGLALAGLRAAPRSSGAIGLFALLGTAAATLLVMTGSKGAIAAGAGGVTLMVVAHVLARRPLPPRVGAAVATGVVLAALGAVAVRGTLLPESFAGDRSLLFRWHYLVASGRMIAAHPLVGVGPGSFQTAYVQHRPPRNPEEVASAHSVFFDWLATLGLSALAWIALGLLLAAAAGRTLVGATEGDEERSARAPPRAWQWLTAAAGGGALLLAHTCEVHVIDELGVLFRLLGVAGFVLLVPLVAETLGTYARRDVSRVLAAAAITVLVHTQIEMTMTRPGPAAWSWLTLAAAGAGLVTIRLRGVGAVALAAVTAATVWITANGVVPAWRQERLLREAAALIADPAGPRRLAAADRLRAAHDAMPTAVGPRRWAAEQVLAVRHEAPAAYLREALAELQAEMRQVPNGAAAAMAVSVLRELAEVTGDDRHRDQAIEIAERLVAADPEGLGAHRRLGDLQWEAGRREEAADVYRRALAIDDDYAFDPLKQLSVEERRRIDGRIGG